MGELISGDRLKRARLSGVKKILLGAHFRRVKKSSVRRLWKDKSKFEILKDFISVF